MRWSKLKQLIEDGFAESVKGRVEIWSTRYRRAHDQFGEAWITIDGKRLHSMSSLRFEIDRMEAAKSFEDQHGREAWIRGGWQTCEQELASEGSMGLWAVNSTLFAYLSLSFDEILSSKTALVRAIGMLDRRLGKRRLMTIDTSGSPTFVQELYRFRCACEGIAPPAVRNELPGGI
jgi:hypothetical protein